jgi:uncharacterized protein (TIGR02246 family)
VSFDTAPSVEESRPSMRSIATERLILEPQVAAHADEMFALLQDPAIYRYENEAPRSVELLRERFLRLETRASPDGAQTWLNWVVRLPAAGLIGFVQATVHRDGSAGVAYVFGSAYWGRGLAYEAVHAMLRELAEHWRVGLARAVLKRSNLRSVRLLIRLGFDDVPSAALQPGEIEADEALMIRDIRAVALERPMTADERAIRMLISTWLNATRAGDADKVLTLMSDEVVFLTAGHPPVRGKATFAASQQALANASIEASGDVQEIRTFGEWGYAWTNLTVTITPRGGTAVTRTGPTLTVFRKERDAWVLFRDANMLAPVAR